MLRARSSHMCNGIIYLVMFIAFLIPNLQSLSQLKFLSTIKPGLIIYVAIEIAIYGIQSLLQFSMILFLKKHTIYKIFDTHIGNLLSLVIFANMIFGCTQFWNS